MAKNKLASTGSQRIIQRMTEIMPSQEKKTNKIVLGPVDEFKALGLLKPSFAGTEMATDLQLSLTPDKALMIANSMMNAWTLSDAQQTTLLNDNDPTRLRDIILIDMYLTALVGDKVKTDWLFGKNKAFDDNTVIKVLLENGTTKVREYLDAAVYGGGW